MSQQGGDKTVKPRDPSSAPSARVKANFPGGKGAGANSILRVAIDRAPLAELIAHAAATPEVEVGGVLVGYVGEDPGGTFVHVQAVIRGEQAREQSAHVTFTHETWNHIHSEMDRRHPGRQIVGWYHTHPGFGVFLSEMDAFIHQNFFSHPHHVALVYDPLAGKTAIYAQGKNGLARLDRYWRDGREAELDAGAAAGETADGPTGVAREIALLRESVGRLERLAATPMRRGWMEDWLIPALLMILIGLVGFQGWVSMRDAAELQWKAEIFDQLRTLVESGMIRIQDAAGRTITLDEPRARPGGGPPPSQARPRMTPPRPEPGRPTADPAPPPGGGHR